MSSDKPVALVTGAHRGIGAAIARTLGLERLSVFMRRVDDRPRKT